MACSPACSRPQRTASNVYRQQHPDVSQQERTFDGMVTIAAVAQEMLELIEELAQHDLG
jgi:hypothetical protein